MTPSSSPKHIHQRKFSECQTKTFVLVSAFSALAYNKRRMKKIAVEASQEPEETCLSPTVSLDTPFGARALQKGIQIEGVWFSNANTPYPSSCQPAPRAENQPPSAMASNADASEPTRLPTALSEKSGNAGKPQSKQRASMSGKFGRNHDPKRGAGHFTDASILRTPRRGIVRRPSVMKRRDQSTQKARISRGKSLWSSQTKPFKCLWVLTAMFLSTAFTRKDRRSSEELRREVSRIFHENFRVDADESLELNIISPGQS